MSRSSRAEEILRFWFGDLAGPEGWPEEQAGTWFTADEARDYFLRQVYEPEIVAARAGRREEWKRTPRGALAWLLLLDQFGRSVYRGFPAAYESDLSCQIACLEGVEAGHDRALLPVERVFFYMPLQHAEDLEVQDRSVELFTALRDEAPAPVRGRLETVLDFAVRHREVIAAFGRFPHRNAILGRDSTPEERVHLEDPRYRF